MLNPVENFNKLVKFDNPEYIPSSIPEHKVSYLGCHHEGFDGTGHHSPAGTVWTDVWGITWRKEFDGVMGYPQENPLNDIEKIDEYKFPDLNDPKYTSRIYENAKNNDNKILSGINNNVVWERACYLVGMENLMVYLYTEPELVKKKKKKIMDFQLLAASHYIKAGCKMIGMADDMGTQNSLLLGMDIFNEFILPEYNRLFQYYSDKDVIINFHSCGYVEPMIETFIKLGVNILNPVQATANNLEKIAEIAKNRIVIQGAVDSGIVYAGSEEDIRGVVRKRIDVLGKNGEYICCPDQGLNYSQESINILEDEVAKYGKL
jgi:uroporphyrinogen decarboxylase